MKIALSGAVLVLLALSMQSKLHAQSISTGTPSGSPFCAGTTITVSYTSSSTTFLAGNAFTVRLSDPTGSFATYTSLTTTPIGPTTNTSSSGNLSAVIPLTVASGTAYRVMVVSSNPALNIQNVTAFSNTSDLTINAPTTPIPTISATSFCQSSTVTITFTTSCAFGAGNIFTAQLSNASGSFASPTNLTPTLTSSGAGTKTITTSMPSGTPAGTGYRIRVIASNPATTGPDNGSDITVLAPVGTPSGPNGVGSGFGTTAWNVYAYTGTNATITSNFYDGYYTENNLSFNTINRWGNAAGPNAADNTTGLAYSGCPVTNNTGVQYSMSFKRTNFTCGYYQIDIPYHDDNITMFINGSQVFQHIGCCDAHTNTWTGFLGTNSTVEFQLINFNGPGSLQVTFGTGVNPLTMSTPATVCSGTATTLTVSSPLTLTYAWTPTATLSPTTGGSVTATPSATTIYTATGTDASTTCTVSNTVTVTVASNFTTTITATNAIICSSVTTSTLTASGANTYSWTSSADGYVSVISTSNAITVNPASTTTYKVTGSIGACHATNTASQTVTVQTLPPNPPNPATDFGNGVWNVYAYNGTTIGTNYYGYYTENKLNFNTQERWASGGTTGPSAATATGTNGASGQTYLGCNVAIPWAMSFKRTGIPCGYYQIDVPGHDDNLYLLINGTQVYSVGYTAATATNVWSGFISPSTTVEFQLVNTGGPGYLQVNFTASSPLTLSPPAVICANTNSAITATSSVAGVTYQWSETPSDPTVTFANAAAANTFVQTTAATPGGNYTLTNTVTDAAGTGCTASASVQLTVNPLPSTTVTPSAISTYCPSAGITLTASGANTYTWNPTTGLSGYGTGSGYQVVATPLVTTTYTVTGSNNCSTNNASSTITVLALPSIATFPSGTWNAYGFNSQTIGTNYQGYYTENGSGTSGYDFNTTTKWASGAAPSTATATNGSAWQGCVMLATNISLSFKRTNFACGIYQINILSHDDGFAIIINGTTVASSASTAGTGVMWTGALGPNSQVELQLMQGTGGSGINVQFTPVTQAATTRVWIGGTSSDWSTTSNWCSSVPAGSSDALIPSAGPIYMPSINNTGAVVRNLTINPAIAAGTYTTAIPAASLTISSSNALGVYGNWTNNGSFISNTSSVRFVGSGASTIVSSLPETFYNLIINNPSGVTISTGSNQVAGNMTFTSGVVTQNGGLTILNGATVSGASNGSYVNGYIQKVGNSVFTFPVGAGGLYRPISISAPSVVTDAFSAQYFNTSTLGIYPNSSRDNTLDHISGAENWSLVRPVGSSSVSVTLSWDTNSGGIDATHLSDLRVARWDLVTSKWKDQGSPVTLGTNPNGSRGPNGTAGTVTGASATSTFSTFTLADANGYNALPIQLISFDGVLDNNKVNLTWSTASELNSDYFNVERSANGVSFENIGKIKGAGNSTQLNNYSLIDADPLFGLSYYRLKQTDLDGKYTYSETIAVENASQQSGITVYPNPADDKINLALNGAAFQSLTFWDSMGQQLRVSYAVDGSSNVTIKSGALTAGLYIIRVWAGGKLSEHKVVVAR